MSKYFIKKHCEAGELITIALDRSQDYYYGNNSTSGYVIRDFEPRSFEVERYGFSSVEEAKPLFLKMLEAAEKENKEGQWKITLEIVEVNYER